MKSWRAVVSAEPLAFRSRIETFSSRSSDLFFVLRSGSMESKVQGGTSQFKTARNMR